jgi:hypothetical protein
MTREENGLKGLMNGIALMVHAVIVVLNLCVLKHITVLDAVRKLNPRKIRQNQI